MSSCTTTAHFLIDNTPIALAEVNQHLKAQLLPDVGIAETEILSDGRLKITLIAEETELSEDAIFSLLQQLSDCATDIWIKQWHNNAADQQYYIWYQSRVLLFDSVEDIARYKQDCEQPATLSFNYGKSGRGQTALIRLKVSSASKLKVLHQLFHRFIGIKSEEQYQAFVADFNAKTQSKQHDVQWCRFKWKGEEKWYSPGPTRLIYGLSDVASADDSLYLAFNLNRAGLLNEKDWPALLETLYFVLFNLFGVKKVWLKVRPEDPALAEWYLYHPGLGDEPAADWYQLNDDNDWP
ncbi:hypothetical protein ORJ04_20985 [Rheinheimera baltica]|uniref:Uncharacterized protein n=1 Tax=Rheinheimera baltica TaxID=67576 RepID=A0ABT9I4U2_9GAMM|nr:hypothetical protein [Rheinheimera baltica]MDP5138426.1 hypothetical protein [Rheinheimera baltica]